MPSFRTPQVGVGAVAVRDGSILLIQRAAPPHPGLWSLPGGRLEWGESLDEALHREVMEETGLEVKVLGQAGVVERRDEQEGFHYVIVDYFVEVTGGDLSPGSDAADATWVPLGSIGSLPLVPLLEEALRGFGVLQ